MTGADLTGASPADDAAWAALLPDGTVWLSRPARRTRIAAGSAAAAAPWALRSRPGSAVRAYVAVPSRQRPLIVASWDRVVLRYLADTVLSVPPGTGRVLSAVLSIGLRMLRFPGTWRIAVVFRAGGAVLVGRAE
jgi:hypothetical protein